MTFPSTLGPAAIALILAGCVGSIPEPPPTPGTAHYQLSCDSPIGTVQTWLIYTVTAGAEPVVSGHSVTYGINAPIAQVKSPVTATFRKSVITFAIPDGLSVTSVSASPTTMAGFDGINAVQDGSNIVFTLTGDFPLDGTNHPVPSVEVTGTVTASSGSTVVWMTPISVQGDATAGIFGDQSTNCGFDTPGPIWTSHVQ